MKTEQIISLFCKEKISFGQREASKIVGGRTRLTELVATGKIRVEQKSNSQNAKWFCNGGDVIANAKFK